MQTVSQSLCTFSYLKSLLVTDCLSTFWIIALQVRTTQMSFASSWYKHFKCPPSLYFLAVFTVFTAAVSSPPPPSPSAPERLPAPHSSPVKPVPAPQLVSDPSLSLLRRPCYRERTWMRGVQRRARLRRMRREGRRSPPDWGTGDCFWWGWTLLM